MKKFDFQHLGVPNQSTNHYTSCNDTNKTTLIRKSRYRRGGKKISNVRTEHLQIFYHHRMNMEKYIYICIYIEVKTNVIRPKDHPLPPPPPNKFTPFILLPLCVPHCTCVSLGVSVTAHPCVCWHL